MTMPPIVPGNQQGPEPVPPQVIYVQQDPRLAKQAVASGVGSAATTFVIIVLSVCVGIPLLMFLGWMALAGFGALVGK